MQALIRNKGAQGTPIFPAKPIVLSSQEPWGKWTVCNRLMDLVHSGATYSVTEQKVPVEEFITGFMGEQ